MNDDIGAFEGTQWIGVGKVLSMTRVLRACAILHSVDIEHDERGVRERFAEKRLRVGAENGVDLLVGPVRSTKSTSIPCAYRDGEKIIGARKASNLNDMIAARRY